MQIQLKSKKYGNAFLIIDDEDYVKIKDKTWTLICDHGKMYATTGMYIKGKPRSIRIHRFLLDIWDSSIHVDHRDNNGLNNCKSNIRAATIAENSRNVGITIRNTTGFKGVYEYAKGKKIKYGARIRANGGKVFGGYFEKVIDAAKKYNEMAIKYHGDFAYINNIPNE